MVFVLGIERSATTWVSNILDMHSHTELYMEPLSANTSRFQAWPNRFVEIRDEKDKADYFWDEFGYLKRRKKLFFSRFSDTDFAWSFDMKIAQKLWRASYRARDFFELNFHRLGTRGYPQKSKQPLVVIKELRLNYNAKVIKQIDPTVKVIVMLRNYAANVKSIAQHIREGSLSELEHLLNTRYREINTKNIFDYWAESYNTLLTALDEQNMDYLLVRQEDLMQSGKESVERLLQFIGLDPEQSVHNYLSISNASGKGKHSTERNHAVILEKNKQAEKELYPVLADQIQQIQWHSSLQKIVTKP